MLLRGSTPDALESLPHVREPSQVLRQVLARACDMTNCLFGALAGTLEPLLGRGDVLAIPAGKRPPFVHGRSVRR